MNKIFLFITIFLVIFNLQGCQKTKLSNPNASTIVESITTSTPYPNNKTATDTNKESYSSFSQNDESKNIESQKDSSAGSQNEENESAIIQGTESKTSTIPGIVKSSTPLPMEENQFEIERKNADVNGDGVEETIILYGYRSNRNPDCCDYLKLLVVENITQKTLIEQKVAFSFCTSQNLTIGDLDNDKIPDIVVKANSRGIEDHILYSCKGNKIVVIPSNSIDKNTFVTHDFDNGKAIFHVDGIKDEYIAYLNKYQKLLYQKYYQKNDSTYNGRFGYFQNKLWEIHDYDNDGQLELTNHEMFVADYPDSGIAFFNVTYKLINSSWKPISAHITSLNKVKSTKDIEKDITNNDLKISNISIGATYDNIIKILGKPTKETRYESEDLLALLCYDNGISVYLRPNVSNIEVTNKGFLTPRGLQIGDTKEKVIDLYGEPDHDKNYILIDAWEYWTDNAGKLYIGFENGKVNKIKFEVIPF